MNLLAPKPKPTVTPPAPMPLPDDEASREARKKQALASQQRSGRMSTILTDGSSEKVGG